MKKRIDTERIKKANPIPEVLARYGIELVGRGRNRKALCPFHDDRNPSMSVSLDKGLWYCHACDLGGDVITFVQEIENVDFREACEILSSGRLPELDPSIPQPRRFSPGPPEPELTRVEKEVLDLAIRVYHTTLVIGEKGPGTPYGYLLERGLTVETIQEFQVGFCTGEDLNPALRYVRSDPKYAEDIGLLQKKGKRTWELFSGRIVFVERNRRGQVVHMAGRSFQKKARAKYLFLPGLSKPVYGMSRLSPTTPTFVVEGIFDYVTIRQWGYQSVATLGTSIKEWDAHKISRGPVILVPDNDAAGIAAAARWKETIGHGRVLQLPQGVGDTNDLAQQPNGQDIFHDLVNAPIKPICSPAKKGPLFIVYGLFDCSRLWEWEYRAAAVEDVPMGNLGELEGFAGDVVYVLGQEGQETVQEWERHIGTGITLHLPNDLPQVYDLRGREGKKTFRRLVEQAMEGG